MKTVASLWNSLTIMHAFDTFIFVEACIHIQQYNHLVYVETIYKNTSSQKRHVCYNDSHLSLKAVVISRCGERSTGGPYR